MPFPMLANQAAAYPAPAGQRAPFGNPGPAWGAPQGPTNAPPGFPIPYSQAPAAAPLGGSLSPESMRQMSQLLANPQARAQFEAMAKRGLIPSKLLADLTAGGALGPAPLSGSKTLLAALAGCAIGLPMSMATASTVHNLEQALLVDAGQKSRFLRALQGFSKLPGVRQLDRAWETALANPTVADPTRAPMYRFVDAAIHRPLDRAVAKLKSGAGKPGLNAAGKFVETLRNRTAAVLKDWASRPGHEAFLARFDSALTGQQVTDNFFRMHLAKNGHLWHTFQGMKPEYVKALSAARSVDAVEQLIDSNPMRFMPADVRQIAESHLSGGFLRNRIFKPLRTFGQKRLSPKVQHWLAKHSPAKVKSLFQVQHSTLGTLEKQLAKEGIPLAKPLWETLRENSQTVLGGAERRITQNTTLAELNALFGKEHILHRGHARKAIESVQKGMMGFLRRAGHTETYHQQLVGVENGISTALKKQKVGPLGRFLAKAVLHLKRALDGENFGNRINRLSKLGKVIPPSGGTSLQTWGFRLLVSVTTIGMGLSGLFNSSKEARGANFSENMATGLGGLIGYEIGRSVSSELGLLTRFRHVNWLGNKVWLKAGPIKLTVAGVISEVIVPLMVASLVSVGAKKISHAIFGNPKQIDDAVKARKAYAEALARQPKPAPAKPAEATESATENPSDTATASDAPTPQTNSTEPPKPEPPKKPEPLTPETTGLTLEAISRNKFQQPATPFAEPVSLEEIWRYA